MRNRKLAYIIVSHAVFCILNSVKSIRWALILGSAFLSYRFILPATANTQSGIKANLRVTYIYWLLDRFVEIKVVSAACLQTTLQALYLTE